MIFGKVIWLRRILIEFDFPCTKPTHVYNDIQEAIHIARNPVFYERTNHIEVDEND